MPSGSRCAAATASPTPSCATTRRRAAGPRGSRSRARARAIAAAPDGVWVAHLDTPTVAHLDADDRPGDGERPPPPAGVRPGLGCGPCVGEPAHGRHARAHRTADRRARVDRRAAPPDADRRRRRPRVRHRASPITRSASSTRAPRGRSGSRFRSGSTRSRSPATPSTSGSRRSGTTASRGWTCADHRSRRLTSPSSSARCASAARFWFWGRSVRPNVSNSSCSVPFTVSTLTTSSSAICRLEAGAA